MSDPYLGQIEAFPYNFAPRNWLPCQGQLLSIAQNAALFSLLGTTYGGNGIQTFALPDLQGRVAMGQGNGPGLTQRVIGETEGEVNHTILLSEMPMHNHLLNTAANASAGSNTDVPGATALLTNATGVDATVNPYVATPPAPTVVMAATAISSTTGNQAHANMMPYLGLRFCIATSGIFPSRN